MTEPISPEESQSKDIPEVQGMQGRVGLLLVSVFIIAICGILYELLISTMSSYFQGSSILHFSLVIGLFLSFMGVGSYLSRFLTKDLLRWFILFEILLSVVGGSSALLLYGAFSLTPYFYGVAFILIGLLGSMIGIEIPILTRIVRQYESLRDAMAKVLSFDYLGALIASVAFPLILLPTLGTMRTAFIIGLLNLSVAIMNAWMFRKDLPSYRKLLVYCGIVGVFLVVGFGYSLQINRFFDTFLYQDQILLSRQSPYQHIVMTRWNQDTRLFIDGNIQFSSVDEHRYHEPLVHAPLSMSMSRENVLILGGGDGLAVREVLRYQDVKHISLIDLDPVMTDLGKGHPVLVRLNDSAMNDPRVSVINADAYKYIEEGSELYDVIIIDLPDPNHAALGKLYSEEFYRLISKRLAAGGAMITQSTSPYFAPEAFWCIHRTMESVFSETVPLNVYVPSFGNWGFNLAIKHPGRLKTDTDVELPIQAADLFAERLLSQPWADTLTFLNRATIQSLFAFGEDMAEREVEIQKLDDQALLQYYERSWDQWR